MLRTPIGIHLFKRSATETTGIITRSDSARVLKDAHEYVRAHGRRKVTTEHQENILKGPGGLFTQRRKP